MNASSWRCAYERTLRSPQPFLIRFNGRGINEEESTRLRLPAAEGSGTFQPHQMIPIHSDLPPRHSQQLDRNRSQERTSIVYTRASWIRQLSALHEPFGLAIRRQHAALLQSPQQRERGQAREPSSA